MTPSLSYVCSQLIDTVVLISAVTTKVTWVSGNGNPLQSSCLENPRDRGAWRAAVHAITKSHTQESNAHSYSLCVCVCVCVCVLAAHSCLTLCDPMDCSPPGSSVHGILQARRLEWVAIPFSTLSLYTYMYSYRHICASMHMRSWIGKLQCKSVNWTRHTDVFWHPSSPIPSLPACSLWECIRTADQGVSSSANSFALNANVTEPEDSITVPKPSSESNNISGWQKVPAFP